MLKGLSVKEIVMMILALLLMFGLYYLKSSPNIFADNQATAEHSPPTMASNKPQAKQLPTIDKSKLPEIVAEEVQIPQWLDNKGDYDTEHLTAADLWDFAQQSHQQEHDFFPERQNALFYLLKARQNGLETPESEQLLTELHARLYAAAELASSQYQAQRLKDLTARLKSIDAEDEKIAGYTETIARIYSLERLLKKAKTQLDNDTFVSDNQDDLLHTLANLERLDPNYPAAIELKNSSIAKLNQLVLRATEENDYQAAEQTLQIAKQIDAEHVEVAAIEEMIARHKQSRFSYLDEQFYLAIERLDSRRATDLINRLASLELAPEQIAEYRATLSQMQTYAHYKVGENFVDELNNGEQGPEMVVVPTGQFKMGSNTGLKHHRPAHRVDLDYGFAISKNEITVAEFRQFVEQSGYVGDAEKNNGSQIYDSRGGRIKRKSHVNWRHDYLGKIAADNSPVVHISYNDAQAYVKWLSAQSEHSYRLPSESEFEYLLSAGSQTLYPWGNQAPTKTIGNFSGGKDRLRGSRIRWRKGFPDYQDGYWGAAPVGRFVPNPYGINDLSGNVMEWVADCWHDSYQRAPKNGQAWINYGCTHHVIRGGHWGSSKSAYFTRHRLKARKNHTDLRLGFRVARNLID